MTEIQMTVNGKAVRGTVEGRTLLVNFLREDLRLTGTHVGCDTSQCGACTVHVDGKAERACLVRLSEVEGKSVTTIEGLDPNGDHRVQQAWRDLNVPQCGFCQAGQIMQAASLLSENPNPSDQEILEGMEGNICRCGCYERITAAVKQAATGS